MSSSTDHGASWEQVLGKKLVRSAGEGAVEVVDTATALKGKHVGLYFSAHWWVVSECRGRTVAVFIVSS
jgi:hypothetical protein